MSLRERAAIGLKWHVLEVGGRQLLSLAVFTTLARLLQPTDFGLVGMVVAYLALINMFVDQGIRTALIQRQHLEPEHVEAAFWFNLACGVGVCVLTIGMSDVLARVASEPRVGPLLRWASVGMVVNALGAVQAALFVKRIDFKFLTLRTWVANAAAGVVAVTMAYSGYGVWALIVHQLISSIVGVTFLWAVSPWRPTFRFSPRHLRQLMRVSASVFASSLLWVFSSRIDQLVVGRFAGASVLGQYVIGLRLAEVARAAVHEPMAAVAMPALSRVQSDYQRLRHSLYSAMEMHSVVCFAAFVGLAAIAPSIVPLVFGHHWSDAGNILQVVAIYSLVVALSVFYHSALLASGGIGGYVFINIACAVGATAACLIGIQSGVRTVVVLLTVNMVAMSGIALVFLRNRIGLNVWQFCRPCVVPAIAASLMFAGVETTRLAVAAAVPLALQTGLEIVVGAGVYILIMWILAKDTILRIWEVGRGAVLSRSWHPAVPEDAHPEGAEGASYGARVSS